MVLSLIIIIIIIIADSSIHIMIINMGDAAVSLDDSFRMVATGTGGRGCHHDKTKYGVGL